MLTRYNKTNPKTMERPKQNNCQNEPAYPNHETVVFSLRFPDVYMDKDCEIKKWAEINPKTQDYGK